MRLAAPASVLAPILALALAFAGPALAQDRAPVERQTLLDLAYTLGQAHALRQACAGEDDQHWRDRMVRLSEVEAADQDFDGQLKERFNAGYANGQAEHPSCSIESRKALVATAARGQALAGRMSTITHVVRPKAPADPYAEPETPSAEAEQPR